MITQKVKINGIWQTVTGGISSGNSDITIVDNLNSSDSTAALSANQGRVLKEMIEELPSGGGAAGETKIYEVYASPQNDDELAANIKVYNAVMNGENAIYRTYSEMGWLTATLAFSVSSLVSLTFEVSQNASDGSGLTTTQISMALNSSGSPIVSLESPISIPSTSKVEEMVGTSGGSNGLEIRILSDDTPEENLRTIELVKEGKALAGLADEFGVSILTYLGDRKFSQTTYVEDWQTHIASCIELGENGNLISQAGYVLTGDLTIASSVEFKLWLRWQTSLSEISTSLIRTIYVVEENQRCLVDSISFNSTTTEFQYNYNDKRYKRVYTNETGEYTKEEIVVNSGGGTGGSSGTKTYTVYCELSEDELEKALQLEANIAAYNACNNNEDAVYKLVLPIGYTVMATSPNGESGSVGFIGELAMGASESYGGILTYVLDIAPDGTPAWEYFVYNLQSSYSTTVFLDTTTTEKTIAGVSQIIEYISAGEGVTVIWYKGGEYIHTCNTVGLYVNGIIVGIQEASEYNTYIIKNTGEITQFLKVGALKLNHSTVENEKNKKAIDSLSILLSTYGDLTGAVSLSILHKPNYYQVLHTKKVDDSYKMKVILDDNSFGTYTLQSNGILTLDS